MIDRNGKDITGQFTPLPKKLLLFILLHSLGNDKGVSSDVLYETFWFDKSPESARNNRAVNIVKLKSLLDNLDSASISPFQVGSILLVIVVLTAAFALLIRRFLRGARLAPGKRKVLELVDAMAIGPKRFVYVINLEGRTLVVGAGGDQVSLLAEYGEDEWPAAREESVAMPEAAPAPREQSGADSNGAARMTTGASSPFAWCRFITRTTSVRPGSSGASASSAAMAASMADSAPPREASPASAATRTVSRT